MSIYFPVLVCFIFPLCCSLLQYFSFLCLLFSLGWQILAWSKPNHLKISSHNLVANLQCIKIWSTFSPCLFTKKISTHANNLSYPKILRHKSHPSKLAKKYTFLDTFGIHTEPCKKLTSVLTRSFPTPNSNIGSGSHCFWSKSSNLWSSDISQSWKFLLNPKSQKVLSPCILLTYWTDTSFWQETQYKTGNSSLSTKPPHHFWPPKLTLLPPPILKAMLSLKTFHPFIILLYTPHLKGIVITFVPQPLPFHHIYPQSPLSKKLLPH